MGWKIIFKTFKKVGDREKVIKKAELVLTNEEINKDQEIEIVIQYATSEEPIVLGVAKDAKEIQKVRIIYPGEEWYVKEFEKDEKDPQWLEEMLYLIAEELMWDRSTLIYAYSS
ncbi:MAG: hypothetical protein QXT86_10835 [Archaeoglobaceae archaeon]